MNRRRAQSAPSSVPVLAEWDFDLGGCPTSELEHCCFYEYALESGSVCRLVEIWRTNRKLLAPADNPIDDKIRDRWFGLPFRVLADHPEFPSTHWLQIRPERRIQKVAKLRPYSQITFPDFCLVYGGPQGAHFTRLRAEQMRWQAIQKQKAELLDIFCGAERVSSIRALPSLLRAYLTDSEVAKWGNRLTKLTGERLLEAASKLRKECEKKIGELQRQQRELVVYEVDWTLRPHELKEQFGQWATVNRVHGPRERGGGHPAKAVELLKALGAKRLLDFFREHQKKLPLPYRSQTLHDGLQEFTRDQRKDAGRPVQPLYKTRKGWNHAKTLACDYLSKNFL